MADPNSTHVHHGFDYIVIPVLDLERAEHFYGAAFGWRFEPYGPEYLSIITPDGREAGGLSEVAEISEVTPGSIMVVLYSRDLESTQESVIAAGGTVVREIFPFPGGRRFHFTDPSGNKIGVWSLGA